MFERLLAAFAGRGLLCAPDRVPAPADPAGEDGVGGDGDSDEQRPRDVAADPHEARERHEIGGDHEPQPDHQTGDEALVWVDSHRRLVWLLAEYPCVRARGIVGESFSLPIPT